MTWKDKYGKKIKKIIKQATGLITADDGALIPSAKIKGTGHIWCYSPVRNKFFRTPRGIQVYIVDDKEDEKGRIVVYSVLVDILLIDVEELSTAGFD